MMLMASITTTVTKLETTPGEQITDLGTIFLEKKVYYAEISVYSPIIMAVIGERTAFKFKMVNREYADDTTMSVEGLPEGFYATFEEGKVTISDIFVESGGIKDVTLNI